MTSELLIMLAGFFLLWKGGDHLVDGASSLALRFGLSPFVVGLTIVAFGTSAPELCVSLIAASHGKADIIFGNILGSNISNLLLILGVSGMIAPLAIHKKYVVRTIPLSILILGALSLLLLFQSDATTMNLTSGKAVLLLISFLVILALSIDGQSKKDTSLDVDTSISLPVASVKVLFGILALPLGAKWVVDPAIFLAIKFGVSEVLVSVLTVAVGTSLPELVTSVTAALKKESDIAIGNVVGSNIFNIGLILGISGLVTPMPFNPQLFVEILVIALASMGIMTLVYTPPRFTLSRWQSGLLFMGYVAYVVFVVMRG